MLKIRVAIEDCDFTLLWARNTAFEVDTRAFNASRMMMYMSPGGFRLLFRKLAVVMNGDMVADFGCSIRTHVA